MRRRASRRLIRHTGMRHWLIIGTQHNAAQYPAAPVLRNRTTSASERKRQHAH